MLKLLPKRLEGAKADCTDAISYKQHNQHYVGVARWYGDHCYLAVVLDDGTLIKVIPSNDEMFTKVDFVIRMLNLMVEHTIKLGPLCKHGFMSRVLVHNYDPRGKLTETVYRIGLPTGQYGYFLGAYGPYFEAGVAYTRSAASIMVAFNRGYRLTEMPHISSEKR